MLVASSDLQCGGAAEHEDGVEEHDEVAARHEERVEEDRLPAHLAEALGRVGEHRGGGRGAVQANLDEFLLPLKQMIIISRLSRIFHYLTSSVVLSASWSSRPLP